MRSSLVAAAVAAVAARRAARYTPVDWSFAGRTVFDRPPLEDGNGPSLQLFNCSDDPKIRPNQIWSHNTTFNELVVVSTGYCMDVDNYAIADQSEVWTYTCHPEDKDPAHNNQAWSINANGTITEFMSGSCLDASNFGVEPGSQVWLYHCTGAANQQWQIVNEADGFRIVGVQSGLCLDAGTQIDPCAMPPTNTMPFCNASLPLPDRVFDIVNNTPSTEAWGLFNTGSSGVGSLLISQYQWWSEALHGVAYSPGVTFGGALPGATSFPTVSTSSMSFNRSLWNAIGSTVSTEARAFNNLGQAGLTFWAPNTNIFRDPRWGRGQETPGEDPFLSGEYTVQFVTGMQEGEDPRYLKVSSCCKHYAAYSLESWNGTDRHHFNAIVTSQDEVDTYLPAFQACVQDAHASSLMCSYNAVNGVPSCADGFLLNTIARGQWGFSDASYITSDCGAVSDIQYAHGYTDNTNDTCKVTLEGGCDIGCDGFLPPNLPAAVAGGAVSMDTVNTALTHLWGTRMRLGVFDPPETQPYRQIPPSAVCTNDSQALALAGAQQGLALLKNTAKGLPLTTTSVKTLAVVGPNAQAQGTMQGNYYGSPCGTIVSPAAALGSFATVNYQAGCSIASNDTSGFPAAIAAAAAADATVVIVGIDQSQESEGNDRVIISFPGAQEQLITQVCAASKGPCIVVVMAGGSLDISAAMADTNVQAIIWTGYPGEAGGIAIANTIFQEGGNVPAGRLVQTLYPANFIDAVSMFEMNVRPGASVWPPFTSPGRTYRFYTGTPVVAFGFGLSYTTFSYGISSAPARLSMAATHAYLEANAQYGAAYAPRMSEQVAGYFVNVTNTGSVDAADSVLGFITPPGAGQNGVPLQTLFGFERVFVPAGQTVTVWLGISARDLTQVNAAGQRVAWPGTYTISFGVADTAKHGMGFVQHSVEAL